MNGTRMKQETFYVIVNLVLLWNLVLSFNKVFLRMTMQYHSNKKTTQKVENNVSLQWVRTIMELRTKRRQQENHFILFRNE